MQKYKKLKKISQGAFGTVYQYQNLTPSNQIPSKHVAIKQLFNSSSNPTIKRQLKILKDLPSHPNILKIYQIIQDKFNINIVMQLGKYDLSNYIDIISYPIIKDKQLQIKKIIFQLLNGLKVLHQKQYIHRDLKPSNLIINREGEVKLCDFGSTVKCITKRKEEGKQSNNQQYQLEGFTRWYKSPQMLYGSRKYQYQVDIWSVGCIIMQLATGQPYFDGKSQIQQLSLITKQLGNPNQQNWPVFNQLPDYGKINFKPLKQKSIQQISQQRGITLQLSKFLIKMIKYGKRQSVNQLLNDQYLKQINTENMFLKMPTKNEEQLTKYVKMSYDKIKKQIKLKIKK